MVRAMTTLKPQLVRADTLDLQDHEAPSAQDHSGQPSHPSPYGYGPAAPHQAQTLRHAQEEEYRQHRTSPRVSEDHNGGPYSSDQHFYDDPEDDLEDEHLVQLHGANGVADHDREFEDAETSDAHDDELDDDLMDKISSSPSIEDGKYSLPSWPPRADSVDFGASPAPTSTPTRGTSPCSSSPLIPPFCFPLPAQQEKDQESASHHGENFYDTHQTWDRYSPDSSQKPQLDFHSAPTLDPTQQDLEIQEITKYLLPVDDPLLDNAFDQMDEGFYEDDDEWVGDDESIADYRSSSDDDTENFPFTNDPRFIDSGWGGECLRETEDIDFEFVYALHTFVATVEGQANATKGDTMVLLDDSNSYWWLVRVVKDGSIGYLPAEHIETPTERLARLNKHRNIDLSASMLGDNPEKSKNPLKKAMRRRNAKTVQFAAPTYHEATGYDFSDDEEGDDGQMEHLENGVRVGEVEQAQNEQAAEVAPQTQQSQPVVATNGILKRATSDEDFDDQPASPIKPQALDPVLLGQQQAQEAINRSRKGVVRNTDSFFKDDSAETRKISLTPRLLRGDSDLTGSAEPELRQRPSLETFDKLIGTDEKPKEDKKREKKGMLSGLFKRKDRKGSKVEPEKVEKLSDESTRHSPQSKDSLESLSNSNTGPERKPSKLQKQQPTYISPKSSPTEPRAPQPDGQSGQQNFFPPAPTGPAPAPPIMRQAEHSDEHLERQDEAQAQQLQGQSPTQTPNRFPSLQEKRSIFSPITTALKPSPSTSGDTEPVVKPVYSKRAKERFVIEASDSEEDITPTAGPQMQPHRSISPIDDVHPPHDRTDSGMQIATAEPPASSQAVSKEGDQTIAVNTNHERGQASTSSIQANDVTPIESELTASTSKSSPSTATHSPSTSRSTPTWSDASLRSYMENDQDIKDLLIIVHDKSNVTPAGPDHPLMRSLFSNERTKLAEMQSQLDTMLMGWMSKKNGTLLSR